MSDPIDEPGDEAAFEFPAGPPIPDDDPYSEVSRAKSIAMARALRQKAEKGGLRFEVFLPSSLGAWVLEMVERGIFIDPGEAIFVMMGEQRDLAPHRDLRAEILARSIQAAIDDPRPSISGEEFMAKMQARMAAPRPKPAIWRRQRKLPGSVITLAIVAASLFALSKYTRARSMKPLYRAAMEVERDDQLMAEIAEWDGTVADGLETDPSAAAQE